MSSRQRAAGRNHGCSDKPSSRTDRQAENDSRTYYRLSDSYRHESFSLYQSRNGSFRPPNPVHSNYGMYPMMSVNSVGSLEQVSFTGMNEGAFEVEGGPARFTYEQQRFQGDSSVHSSPEEPSSPQS